MEYHLPGHADLADLLRRNAAASDYFDSLPSGTRKALRRQESITTFAEMQSFAADEGETPFTG